jgi:hypothetical protein
VTVRKSSPAPTVLAECPTADLRPAVECADVTQERNAVQGGLAGSQKHDAKRTGVAERAVTTQPTRMALATTLLAGELALRQSQLELQSISFRLSH